MKRRNFLWYSLLFIAGCTATTNTSNSSASKSSGTQPKELRFAVTDAQGLEELQQDYEPFRKALEEVLEKKIEFVPVESHLAAAAALQLEQVDFMLAGPSEYVVIHARTNAVPVIALTRPNMYSVIAVRADSAIKSLSQLKGKTIAMREVGSTSGHLGATKLLLDAGLNPQSDFKTIMLGDKGLHELKNGKVDAWGGVSHRYEKFLKTEGLSESAFPLLAKGLPLPNDLFIASSKLATGFVEEMRSRMLQNQEKLIQALLSTKNLSTKFRGAQMAPVKDADYNMIRETYKAIGQGDFS